MIDIVFLFIILYFTLSGLQKGFLAYFLEFLLVFICFVGSWLYYRETHNFLLGLIILFLSPIIIVAIFKFLLHISIERAQEIKRLFLSHLNNIFGGIIGFFWGIFWTIIISVVINIIPIDNPSFLKVKENLKSSYVLRFVKAVAPIREIFLVEKMNNLSQIIQSTEATKTLKDNPEFQRLMEEEQIQNFIKDRTVMNQLKDNQILSLLGNPKFIAILENKKILKKFLEVDFEGVLDFARRKGI